MLFVDFLRMLDDLQNDTIPHPRHSWKWILKDLSPPYLFFARRPQPAHTAIFIESPILQSYRLSIGRPEN
jgi:hypothetical protein